MRVYYLDMRAPPYAGASASWCMTSLDQLYYGWRRSHLHLRVYRRNMSLHPKGPVEALCGA